MIGKRGSFVAGIALGIVATAGVVAVAAPASGPEHAKDRPVEVTLHRFDRNRGSEGKFAEWISFLHSRHGEAVATLARERTYFEAMFTAPDDPNHLYWITVQGAGGASVESSNLDLDRRHIAYMDAVLAKGSHERMVTQNVLAPDFIVDAVRREQRAEEK